MPNKIKFTTGTVPGSLAKGNARISTGEAVGPTHKSGFFNGITPPVNGYTFYIKKTGGIVEDGLVFAIDPGHYSSYRPDLGLNEVWDLSGNQNNGTLINGVEYDSGNGGSFTFDGVNDLIQISHSLSLVPTNEITISSWSNTNWQTTSSVRIISKTEGGGWQLSLNDEPGGGTVGLTIHINGSYRYITISKTSISLGYHNIVGTFDSRYAKLYLDGVLVKSIDMGPGSAITYLYNNPLIIGSEPSISGPANTNFFNGNISQVLVYNRYLTQEEILQNFNTEKSRFGL